MGYEYLDARAEDRVELPGGVIGYGKSYNLLEDAVAAAKQAQEKLKAPSVMQGKYDMMLDHSHFWIPIHQSVGHHTDTDRVLGDRGSYATTHFDTLPKATS